MTHFMSLSSPESEMGKRIATHDWSTTKLGAISKWPQSLKTLVGTVLRLPTPALLLWGEDLTQIYNDGYHKLMDDKRQECLGRPIHECESSMWDFDTAIHESVMQRGKSFTLENQRLIRNGSDAPEAGLFTLACSPVLGDDGRANGVLMTVQDTTRFAAHEVDVTERFGDRTEAEEILPEIHRRFLRTFQIETVGVIFFNTDGRITEVNDAFLKMSGFSREDEKAGLLRWDVLTPPEWMPASLRAVEEFKATGRTSPYEKQYLRKDGSRWWALFAAQKISENEGVEFVLDLTERKRAEEAVRNSEAQYRLLFDSIDQGFCVIEVAFDDTGKPFDYRFIEINRAFENHTGLANAEGQWIRKLRPDHEEYWYQIYGKIALTGEPMRFESGARALEQRWFDVYAFRIGQPEQHRVAILFRDITQSKRAEEALHASQTQLQTLIDKAPLGIYLVDWRFRICQVNPTALPTFENVANLIGRDFGEVMHMLGPQAYADEIVERFRHTLETGEPCIVPEHIEERLDGGTPKFYEWQINRIPLSNGRYGVVCYFRDISAQVRTRQSLTNADRQKDEFIATLSHELRNPLASLSSAAQLLQSPDLDAEGRQWAAQVVQRQSKSMGILLDDLLDISRLTLGRLTLRKQHVALATILESALEATRPLMDAANHTFSLTMPPPSVTVDGDPLRLSQVISNLLTNAVKYTNPGGSITLGVEVTSEEVVVTVTDTGIGIDPFAIDHLFTMFAQETNAHDRSNGGLGIGLALVRGIVELHGGWVTAASEGLSKGSCFRVGLPRPIRTYRQATAATLEQQQDPAHAPHYRILIADDNADAAQAVAILLQLSGHETRTATGGKNALEEAERFRPHAIVLDIGMPDLNGYEVAQRIREAPWGHKMSLFAATGWGQEKDKLLAHEAGFDVHLTKPLDSVRLEALITEHVGRRKS
ncbi:MAG TPA: PAS domain S-box protein [Burkholderiales bacterium]|nr:PAS domain S-box protein [Burkholderiales bacterium]